MDADRFDALSRALTNSGSRRTALRALLGTLLGSALLEPTADTLAAPGKRPGKTSKKSSRRHPAHSQDRTAAQTHDPADEAALPQSNPIAREEVGVASHGCRHAGTSCTRPDQCCTGKCLSSGKCSCSASNPCPKPTNPCKRVACSSTRRCVISNKTAGATCTNDGNTCTTDVCDGSGHCTHPPKTSGVPCPDDGNPCTRDICDGNGQCTHPEKPNGTDCGGGQVCQNGLCAVTDPCADGVKNGDETDVDCGGSCPNRCSAGQGCNGDADCAAPNSCGGGGTPGVCGCTPTTCFALRDELCPPDSECEVYGICGPYPDGCGNSLNCGTCAGGHPCFACENGKCVFRPGGVVCGAACCFNSCCFSANQGICGTTTSEIVERCTNGRCCPSGYDCCNARDGSGRSSCYHLQTHCQGDGVFCCGAGNTCCPGEPCCTSDAQCTGGRRCIANGAPSSAGCCSFNF